MLDFFHIDKINKTCTQVIQIKVHGEILQTCQAKKWLEKYVKHLIVSFGTKERQGNLGMEILEIAAYADAGMTL